MSALTEQEAAVVSEMERQIGVLARHDVQLESQPPLLAIIRRLAARVEELELVCAENAEIQADMDDARVALDRAERVAQIYRDGEISRFNECAELRAALDKAEEKAARLVSQIEQPCPHFAAWQAAESRLATARADALEEAAKAMNPMLRTMISRSKAADICRALKDTRKDGEG